MHGEIWSHVPCNATGGLAVQVTCVAFRSAESALSLIHQSLLEQILDKKLSISPFALSETQVVFLFRVLSQLKLEELRDSAL